MISLETWGIHTCFVSNIYDFSKGEKKNPQISALPFFSPRNYFWIVLSYHKSRGQTFKGQPCVMSSLLSKAPNTALAVPSLTELIFPFESSSLSFPGFLHCVCHGEQKQPTTAPFQQRPKFAVSNLNSPYTRTHTSVGGGNLCIFLLHS